MLTCPTRCVRMEVNLRSASLMLTLECFTVVERGTLSAVLQRWPFYLQVAETLVFPPRNYFAALSPETGRGFFEISLRLSVSLFRLSTPGIGPRQRRVSRQFQAKLGARQVCSNSCSSAGSSSRLDLRHSFTWYPVVLGLS